MEKIRYIDLFCGIGGFRTAFEQACKEVGEDIIPECVFSSDIDKYAQFAYEYNFGDRPFGDITQVDERDIPDHDILFAGFPCQPFSIIGQKRGFNDIRGTLFFDIARILKEKKPNAFILENVKQLVGHDNGQTLQVILDTLRELGYHTYAKVLNALDYGLPQKRERIIIVGHKDPIFFAFPPKQQTYTPLSEILVPNPEAKHFLSERIRDKRLASHKPKHFPSIWHENKAGNISSYPYSCALRAGASYNYLVVNGELRLTPREMLRLQGFPDTFEIVVPDGQARKQAGNSVPVKMIKAVMLRVLPFVAESLHAGEVFAEPSIEYTTAYV